MKIKETYLQETKSYADHTPPAKEGILDCSLGVNPYGPPAAALEAVRAFDLGRLGDYPHTMAAHEAIIRYWNSEAALTAENILLTDGSMNAIYLINELFAVPGAEIVGFIPSFTNTIVHAELQGIRYHGICYGEGDPREDMDALIAAIGEKTAMVYVDNPNNPTGRFWNKEELRRLLLAAKERGAYVFIDEAYADFIPKQESVLSELAEFDHLIVARTLSKGFGLAALRAGYIIAAPQVIRCLTKGTHPYCMNEIAREAAAAALGAGQHGLQHIEDFARIKRELRAVSGKTVVMLPTDDRVPICTLKHTGGEDLQKLLYEYGVLTVSGAEFDALGAEYVRLRIPTAEEADRVIAAVSAAEQRR